MMRGAMVATVATVATCALFAQACTGEADPPEAASAISSAIVGGTLDNNRHPQTGALVSYRPASGAVVARCSGTLISPTVFLTAAHCSPGAPGGRGEVTFASPFVFGSSPTHVGKFVPDPAYDQNQADPHDIAVVVFDAPVAGIVPARLPTAGSLGSFSQGQAFTAAGYGVQTLTPGSGVDTQDQSRWMAVTTLNATNPAWLRLSQVAATGSNSGGTCFGDSGGPNFLGAGAQETNIVAGLTISGDAQCLATNVTYRTDTASARAFLKTYVTLP